MSNCGLNENDIFKIITDNGANIVKAFKNDVIEITMYNNIEDNEIEEFDDNIEGDVDEENTETELECIVGSSGNFFINDEVVDSNIINEEEDKNL